MNYLFLMSINIPVFTIATIDSTITPMEPLLGIIFIEQGKVLFGQDDLKLKTEIAINKSKYSTENLKISLRQIKKKSFKHYLKLHYELRNSRI